MALTIQVRLKDLCVERGLTLEQLAALPLPGYSFSDGHSVFKVRLTDELR